MSYNCSTQAKCKHYPASWQCGMCFLKGRVCYCRDVLEFNTIQQLEIAEQYDEKAQQWMVIYPKMEKNSSGNNKTTSEMLVSFMNKILAPSRYNEFNSSGKQKSISSMLTDVKVQEETRWCRFDEIDEISKEYKINQQLILWGVGETENEILTFFNQHNLHLKRFQTTNSRVQKNNHSKDYYETDMNNLDLHGKKRCILKFLYMNHWDLWWCRNNRENSNRQYRTYYYPEHCMPCILHLYMRILEKLFTLLFQCAFTNNNSNSQSLDLIENAETFMKQCLKIFHDPSECETEGTCNLKINHEKK